ncbi:MAG TPA: DEAD/DEAH box helicase [Acidobacteriota bacterium]
METGPTFADFGLSEPVLEGVRTLGYQQPTPVQAAAIPRILAGGDLVVQSRTGTGKTAAFGIPLIEKLEPQPAPVQALILCPTRELAFQVHHELAGLGVPKGVRSSAIYGGSSMRRQLDELRRGVQAVVGTPGRVLDHLSGGSLQLAAVRYLVLDEADEMLSMGFEREMTRILRFVPRERQTLLLSATIPDGVAGLAARYLREHDTLRLSSDALIVREVRHSYVQVPTMEKEEALYKLLVSELPESCIVFCNTRGETRVVTGYLQQRGLPVEMLSGDLSQAQRERVMREIKAHKLRFMVATDVAARGIDIQDLSHVIQFSPPEDPDMYVHRAGRTGRMGKGGVAITLVGYRELPRFSIIEKLPGLTIERRELPGDEEVLEARVEAVLERFRLAEVAADALPEPRRAPYLAAARQWLQEGLDREDLAGLLKLLETGTTRSAADGAAPPAPEPAQTSSEATEPDPGAAAAGADPSRSKRRRRRRRQRSHQTGAPTAGDREPA